MGGEVGLHCSSCTNCKETMIEYRTGPNRKQAAVGAIFTVLFAGLSHYLYKTDVCIVDKPPFFENCPIKADGLISGMFKGDVHRLSIPISGSFALAFAALSALAMFYGVAALRGERVKVIRQGPMDPSASSQKPNHPNNPNHPNHPNYQNPNAVSKPKPPSVLSSPVTTPRGSYRSLGETVTKKDSSESSYSSGSSSEESSSPDKSSYVEQTEVAFGEGSKTTSS